MHALLTFRVGQEGSLAPPFSPKILRRSPQNTPSPLDQLDRRPIVWIEGQSAAAVLAREDKPDLTIGIQARNIEIICLIAPPLSETKKDLKAGQLASPSL